MAFDYGQETLGIKNPFRQEGILDLVYGIPVTIIGIICLFYVRDGVLLNKMPLAWSRMLIGILFLCMGLWYFIKGCFKLFRFLVGRSVPLSLCIEKEEQEGKRPYKATVLASMLKKRYNYTFKEIDNFVSRSIITLFPNFLHLPIAFRNLIETISKALLNTLVISICYLLGLFSISAGLISVTNKEILMNWYGFTMVVFLLALWYKNRPSNPRINKLMAFNISLPRIVLSVIIAIIAPVAIELLLQQGLELPKIDLNSGLAIFTTLFLGSITVVSSFYLSRFRANDIVPNTAVSEYKAEHQHQLHPRDLFRFFDLIMADKRYKELPNRIYREKPPTLKYEGNRSKGNFSGDTIQETQPKYQEKVETHTLRALRLGMAILGRLLGLIACLILFFRVDGIFENAGFAYNFNTFFYSAVFFLFSYYIIRTAHLFWAEMLFTSHLIQFFTNGTFSESKLATGMSVYDSTRSENEIIATKSQSWIFLSRLTTSTICDSTTNNLEGFRFVLEMNKDEPFLNEILEGLSLHIGQTRQIAGINQNSDLNSIDGIKHINKHEGPKISEEISLFRSRTEERNNLGQNNNDREPFK